MDAKNSDQGGVRGGAQIDVALVVVIQAWPNVPEVIQAGIVAMVHVTEQALARLQSAGNPRSE